MGPGSGSSGAQGLRDFLSHLPDLASHGLRAKSLSHIQLFVTPQTAARQAPLSMGFSGKVLERGCHALLQGIFLIQGLSRRLSCFLHLEAGSPPLAPAGKPRMHPGTHRRRPLQGQNRRGAREGPCFCCQGIRGTCPGLLLYPLAPQGLRPAREPPPSHYLGTLGDKGDQAPL